MTKAVAVSAPLHHRDDDKGGGPAGDEPAEVATPPVLIDHAAAYAQQRAAERVALARQRIVPGAAVIIEEAFPDQGVGYGQLGRVISVRGDAAYVSARGAGGFVEVFIGFPSLHWIRS